MLSSVRKSAIWKVVYRGLAFCMVIMIMLGMLPWGSAQASTAQEVAPAQLSGDQPQEFQPPPIYPNQGWTYPNSTSGAAPVHADQSAEYVRSGQLQWQSSSAMRHPEKDVSFLDDIIGPTRHGSGTTQVYDRSVEVSYVGTWLSPGSHDWIWGNALPGSTVTVTAPTETLELYADPENDGFWVVSTSLEPGDAITVTAGDGLNPVSFSIATPFTASANSDTGEVTGQVGDWVNDWVNIHTHWDDVYTPVETDADGIYTVTLADMPQGGSGNVLYSYVEDGADIESQLWFRAPDLLLDVFPSWDSIEGVYALGHSISLVVNDSDVSLKASITIPVEEIWGSITGFNTAEHPELWVDSQPDIVSGDKIYGYVGDGSTESAFVQVGAITGEVDADTDSISGTIEVPWYDPLPGTAWVECHPWGAPDGAPNKWVEVTLDASGVGNYTCEWDPTTEWDVGTNQDIAVSIQDPEGHRVFEIFNDPSYELYLNVNYGHDWIEGSYPPGYQVTLTVYAVNKTTVKGTASGITGEIPWWGGGTGFSTNHNMTWVGDRPNIEAGDWVVGDVTVGEDPYHAEVKLGTIDGVLDVGLDRFTGTVDAPWLDPYTPVSVQCHPWGAPEGVNGIETTVLPDGVDTFTCDWLGEWDVPPNNDIGVSYIDPVGHWIYNVFTGYSDVPIMSIHYDHDWISGNYKPGHDIHLTVYDSAMGVKATTTVETQVFVEWWGEWSGFNTYDAVWSPSHPDIQPGDTVRGEVDDGSQFWAQVKIGLVTAEAVYEHNRVSGTVDASWLMPGPVDVGCYTWEENGRNVYTTAILNESDNKFYYTCEFAGDNYFDLDQGSNLMVAYFDPDGHELIGDFRAPNPHLRIDKGYMGGGSPGVGSNAEFYINYANQGDGDAPDVTLIDTMDGFTYISDTSGVTPTVDINGDGNQVVTWTFGALDAYSWLDFNVFVAVTAAGGVEVSNLVEISTSNPFDQGDPSEKSYLWEGEVIPSSVDLNVGINPWTWNPAPGEDFVYTVGVCNNGSTGSTPVTLTIDFDEALTFNGTWWGREPGWNESSSQVRQLVLTRPTIPGWQCFEIYAQVTLDGGASTHDPLTSRATVAATNDTNPDNNQNEVTHHVGDPNTDLATWQGFHGGSLVPGGEYRYGITVRNEGNKYVTGTVLTTTLPAEVQLLGERYEGMGQVVKQSHVGNVITWQVSELYPGYDIMVELWVKIDPGTPPGTELLHLAAIELQPEENNTENNESLLIEQVYPHGPNLRVYKRGEWHSHEEDKYAWYEVRVENIGDQTVQDVAITDIFPEGMTLRDGPDVHFWEGSECNDDEFGFVCTLDRLEPGWNMSVYFTLTPDLPDPGLVYINTVTVAPNERSDVNPDDNEASYELASGPDMFIEKTLVEGDFQPGTYVTYLLTFGNAQTAHWWGMQGNAIVTDTLPEGMTFVSAYQRWCNEDIEFKCVATPTFEDGGQTLIWDLYPIGAGNWNQIRLLVKIDEGVDKNNPLINVAEISSEHLDDIDPYDHNNQSSYDPGLVTTKNIFLPLILR